MESRIYIVKGKPYISVNRATINAINTPRLRHSYFFFGRKKPKANPANINILNKTIDQRP